MLGTFSILFILFSVLQTVRILNLLGICFEIICCIFVISAVGIICFCIILDYIVIFTGCIFFRKVHFTAIIMLNFFTNKSLKFWWIFFCIPCWLFLQNHVYWQS
jgi:hypothetical protein